MLQRPISQVSPEDWILREYPEPVLIPKERYTSPEFLALEYEKLWPHVWQMACRQEEIANVGDFIEYVIGDQSLLVVRSAPDRIKAFHNVCLHRARRLKKGCGQAATLRCEFHGWCWNLEGRIIDLPDASTFDPRSIVPDDLELPEVRVDTWGGFVFVNFDQDAEPLLTHLGDIPAYMDGALPEDMKAVYIRTANVDANWKVALEAFAEGYHLQGQHRQMLEYFDDTPDENFSAVITGLHGGPGPADAAEVIGRTRLHYSPRLGEGLAIDPRASFHQMVTDLEQAQGMFTPEDLAVATAMLDEELPAGVTPQEVFGARTFAALADEGIRIPPNPGVGAFLIFPHIVGPQSPRAWTLFRARPLGDDPNQCILDMYQLRRFPPHSTPAEIRRVHFDTALSGEEAVDVERYGRIVYQDIVCMAEVQEGLHSVAFPGARPGQHQEGVIRNFHRAVDVYLSR